MARRDGWHYLTRSFSIDGTPGIPLAAPNAATALPVMADAMADAVIPASVRAYHLSWIIHIVGDLHQPMHGTSRSSAADLNGDAGGNRVWVRLPERARDSINLHAVWDGLVERASRDLPINRVRSMRRRCCRRPIFTLGEAIARQRLALAAYRLAALLEARLGEG